MDRRQGKQDTDRICTVAISYRDVERSLRLPPGVHVVGMRDSFNGSIVVGLRGPDFPPVPLGEEPPHALALANVTRDEAGVETIREWQFHFPAQSQAAQPAEVLTVGVDVSDSRVEYAIAGWSADGRCRVVAHGEIENAAPYPGAAGGQPFRDW